MKKQILAIIMVLAMCATLIVPAYALDLSSILDSSTSIDTVTDDVYDVDDADGDSSVDLSDIDFEEILNSDAVQEIIASDGVVDITNTVLDVVMSVSSIDITAMAQEEGVALIQGIIDGLGGQITSTKTNVEVFADDPVSIFNHLFINSGSLDSKYGTDDDDDDNDGNNSSTGSDDFASGYGDVNGDGIVSAADARLILRRSAELITFPDLQEKLADVDHDGRITAKDARIVLRASSQLETIK